ncbi:lysozyme inhibitor LprI family protein [Hoeflea sp. TYP-13]|uniref:lysozyme inhibitor LprI family protein n=1 Tax=Hoeflea sp. TYP-13 TaxID=3230023 RepID=UPI0034C5D05B
MELLLRSRNKTVFAPAIAMMIAMTSPLQAASFDCAKATTADEKAICSNADLSALDSEMAGLWYGYKAMPLLMGASGNRRDEAQAFLKSRASCGSDTACLTKLYNGRIATLQQNIDWAVKNYCNN